MATARKTAKPVSTGPGSDEDFTFESSVGTITVPSCAVAETPPPMLISEIIDEFGENMRAQMKVNILMLKTAVGDEMYGLIRQLHVAELTQFNEQWRAHSGCGLGEYKAS